VIHRHLCIVVGTWKFENWHLYRYREHRNVKGTSRWMMWDKIL
jgi:hypothetical protein